MKAKPFVKWAGGKGAILSKVVECFPEKCSGKYYEPFLGGGAVFFGLKSAGRIKTARLSDRISELTNCYVTLKKNVDGVIDALRRLENLHDPENPEELYYIVRTEFNSGNVTTPEMHAARFIYLNRTCFNGLYRENKAGKFNVPVGRYKNPMICDAFNLVEVSKALKHTHVKHSHWHQAIQKAGSGDWVYFDPPYHTEGENFTNYTSAGFGDAEHAVLATDFFTLVKRGVHVVASNSNTARIRKLYRKAKLIEIEAPRSVAARTEDRKPVTELLIVGAPK